MRVFVAIELPQDLKEKIFALAEKVSRGMAIKLVEKENLHLTLAFLGEVPEEKVQEIVGVLRPSFAKASEGEGLRRVGKICLSLGKWEPFPNKQRPHGIWINVGGETGKLFSLYKKIIDGLLVRGFILEGEDLQFSPHITVGRLKSGGARSLEKVSLPESFVAERVTLFESRLTEKGPIYSKIGEFGVK
ncbi:MAG TPA: RNA 2',3'-cyclic phosphodiesterase [Patescibacteria group bacterium]|nr:RNA 2',3'-cyclic phosphodiesterase [Patescibacteria group bacterium]